MSLLSTSPSLLCTDPSLAIPNFDPLDPTIPHSLINLRGPGKTSDRALDVPRSSIKVLLLEGVHAGAIEILREEGFTVIEGPSMSEEQLLSVIEDVNVVGVRSKTKITKAVMEKARNLLAIGCFCIGFPKPPLTMR
jgi:hypothetical protein